ncbi:MAG: radical SAM protein [Magnetovibrio sp.]|nr:radical SAM protein [Magnetovibrio sp.]
MDKKPFVRDHQFTAIRGEFEFKVDGDRAVIYPLDYINPHIHFITPIQGFALSLLDGQTPFSELDDLFKILFPDCDADTFLNTLQSIDVLIRRHVTQTGIGAEGLIEISDTPIRNARSYDPKEFVISPMDYKTVMGGIKTKYRLRAPINIYTVLTHRCHTDCLYCYADRKKGAEMPLSRWRELISEAAEMGVRLCSPDNGDTFARKDGVDFLECLIEHKMHFLLSTKAHLNHENVKRLMDAGFAKKINGVISRPVQLSVDAIDEALSMQLLNVRKPRLKKTVKTFEHFLSFGIMPVIKSVITGLNCDEPKKIVDYFYQIGARKFTFVRYTRTFHRHSDDLFVTQQNHHSLVTQFSEIRSAYPDIELNENLSMAPSPLQELTSERKKEIWDNRIGCGGGWHALGIGPDGKAFLCEQMAYEEPYFVGDASHLSIRDIWDGDPMYDFIHPPREKFKGASCSACPQFETCMWEQGRCYRDAYFSYGSIYTPPPMCPTNTKSGLRLG